MEPEDPMHRFANLDPTLEAEASTFRRRWRILFLILGLAACLAIMFCPSYDLTEIHDGAQTACTMFAFTPSFPPPYIFLGHRLTDKYWLELAFAVFLTLLTFWRSSKFPLTFWRPSKFPLTFWRPSKFPSPQQDMGEESTKNTGDQFGEMGCLTMIWVALLGGVIIIGLSVLFSSYHHPIWCEDPNGGD